CCLERPRGRDGWCPSLRYAIAFALTTLKDGIERHETGRRRSLQSFARAFPRNTASTQRTPLCPLWCGDLPEARGSFPRALLQDQGRIQFLPQDSGEGRRRA